MREKYGISLIYLKVIVVDPPEEVEICEMEMFSGSEKGEEEIIDVVHHKMAAAKGEIDSDEEDDLLESCITRVQAMLLCEQLAGAVLEYGEAEDIFEFSKQLCRFHAHLRQQEFNKVKQTTLDRYMQRAA